MNEINPESSNMDNSILALQKANIELSNKIDEIYDIALSSTKKVRIGSGFWYMHSTTVIAFFLATLFGLLFITLKLYGIEINFSMSLIWPIPIFIFLWGVVFTSSNTQYAEYQKGCDAMLLQDLKEAIKEATKEAKEEMRLEFEANSKLEAYKREQEATKREQIAKEEATKREQIAKEEATKREQDSIESQKQVQKIIDEFLARIEKINPTL